MTVKEFLEEREMYNPDIEDVILEYTKLKCQELLLLVAEKAEENFTYSFGYSFEDKDSILNIVDLEKFCGGTPSS